VSDAIVVGPPTDPRLLALLAVRLRSRATAAAIGETFSRLGGDAVLDAALEAAEAVGQARRRGEEDWWSLTPAGEAELAAYLAKEAELVGRAEIGTAYEAFLPLNREFLATLAAPISADDRLVVLAALTERLEPQLDSLRERHSRFDGYRSRFGVAVDRAHDDIAWIDASSVDSIHTIWFELHEHLLATLSRNRTQER
jgi:hypothetical protein